MADVVGVGAAERASAVAPATGKDAAAALGVTAMELDEMAAAFADVVRMGIDRGTTAAAIGRVLWRSGIRDTPRNRELTSPRSPHHVLIVRAGCPIVDPDAARSEHRRGPRCAGRGEQSVRGDDRARAALLDATSTGQVGEGECT